MTATFDYFVIFAEMRTGSNFLESNLNALDGVSCLGEVFNPHFIGHPNRTEVLGITQPERDADPAALLDAIRKMPDGLAGFRFFHDHDPRVPDLVLDDPRCAKIILTRNPLDSYVSWKIAQQTGQWKLTNIKRRREALAEFDADEFCQYVANLQDFQLRLLNALQRSGQTPFYLAYEDLQDIDALNGLVKWLGLDTRLAQLDESLTRQNPGPIEDKVANPDQIAAGLAGLDRFNLTRTPNFEPRRGPAVPTYVAAADTALMYLPVRGGPEAEIVRWLAELDGVEPDALITGMNRKQANRWMRANRGHRRFTVVRHPLLRAHSVFCRRILNTGPGSYTRIRNTLRRQFRLPIPEKAPDQEYSLDQHRAAFAAFLEFLRMNLAGQTPIRVDGNWCSQSQTLSSFADFAPPDQVLREDEMKSALPDLARQLGHPDPPTPRDPLPDSPVSLSDIHDAELEALAADIYQRDYLLFGFENWKPA
ncbi:nodulation protein NodH [Ruegeria sediminis]|uniref:Nodulation protein NodH n=1 Tax=Ruegeria sediminis TaxID=2583820 RepID=A0ABY2WWN8_9RHOB|nr:sulfotransferase family 2 domain-containing protein [Ruegeria sediminis]TMV07168.1 nodulation protein NodH [Ruegeria sediminis]